MILLALFDVSKSIQNITKNPQTDLEQEPESKEEIPELSSEDKSNKAENAVSFTESSSDSEPSQQKLTVSNTNELDSLSSKEPNERLVGEELSQKSVQLRIKNKHTETGKSMDNICKVTNRKSHQFYIHYLKDVFRPTHADATLGVESLEFVWDQHDPCCDYRRSMRDSHRTGARYYVGQTYKAQCRLAVGEFIHPPAN